MNIKEFHDLINLISDQEMGSYFPFAKIDSAIDRAQMELWKKYIPDDFAPGQEPHMAVSPFKRQHDFITLSDGSLDISLASGYNADEPFLYLISLETVVADNSLASGTDVPRYSADFVNETEVANRRRSQLIPMSMVDPFFIQRAKTEFQLFPNQEHAGTVRWLKRPPKPVFGYTQVGRVITYDPDTSTQVDWQEQYHNKIAYGACIILGINLSEPDFIKYVSELANG